MVTLVFVTPVREGASGRVPALTAAAVYLWMLARWSRHQNEPAFGRPNLRAHWERITTRPAVARVHEQEGLAPAALVPFPREGVLRRP